MKKKVGLVTCYFKNNYGSQLQAYATQKVIQDLGYETETIECESNIDFKAGKKKYYKSQIFNFSFVKSKFGMIKMKIDTKLNKKLGKNVAIRNAKYKEFKKNYKMSNKYLTYQELGELSKNYASVVVGSDQLWLPVNVVSDYYTLNWVADGVNKISYSTSFGVSSIPDEYKTLYETFLNKIDSLSTRENTGVDIIKNTIGKEAKLVCDPTLLFDKDEWMSIQEEKPFADGDYIFCYFLGNNMEHRKFAERLKEKTGYKIVSLNHCDEYVKYSDKFADEAPFNVGPAEFLNLIRNAKIVLTDSFHGTVFSLIYNKTFFNFRRHSAKNKNNTNSRLDSLLQIAEVSNERILTGTEDVETVLEYKIDFDKVNKNLKIFREDSKEWLKEALEKGDNKDNEKKYIDLKEKANCCGCTACKNVCPKNAIEMVEDEEGFLYPHINQEKCINCGLCSKVCPVLNAKEKKKQQDAYVFQHNNDDVRKESTSGGAFTAIAEYVIDNGGIVYGACFDEDYNVIHKGISNKDELYKFRNSKYVQSNPLNTFKEVKENLENKKLVCYSGTSCQIEGLKNYLGKDYDNLILVDVVCRAVPSPLVWRKYLKLRKSEYSDVKKVYFREKRYGYKYSNLSIYAKNNEYHSGVESDPYLRAFFSNICDRPSCYSCRFKKQHRESDITLWDCFNIEKFDKSLDDDKGTTRILTHTEKGKKVVQEIAKANTLKQIDVDKATKGFLAMFQPVKLNKNRTEFMKDLKNMNEKDLFEKYFPYTLKVKAEKYGRLILLKTGLYKQILGVGKKIRKRD